MPAIMVGGGRSKRRCKRVTCLHNPRRLGHCGYGCVLEASSTNTSSSSIASLRARVAEKIAEMYKKDAYLHDFSIKQVVDMSILSLQDPCM